MHQVYRQYKGKVAPSDLGKVKAFIEHFKEIEVDTETTGLDPHSNEIMSLQLGCPEVQYLLPWDENLIPWLKELFQRTDKVFIFQNAKFDLKFFYKYGIYFANNVYDTFLVEAIINCGKDFVKKGLDHLAQRYLGVDVSKEIRSQINDLGLTQEVIEYGLNDVRYLTLIKREQDKICSVRDLSKAVRLDCSFVRVLAYIEFCGIGFDKPRWLKKAEKDYETLQKLTKELDRMVVEDLQDARFISYGDLFSGGKQQCIINWNSEKQVIPLFHSIGINTTIIDKGQKKDSIGVGVIKPQKDKHPLMPVYLQYAKYQKKVSTFGKDYVKFVHPLTGRIHTEYKQIVNTGRMSCGRKGNKNTVGFPNLQQVPADDPKEVPPEGRHRECFIPAEGNVLVNADYSGQEAVVFANKCQDPALLDFYDKGLGDMHSFVAKMCFRELDDIKLEDVKKERPDLRQKAKSAGFAIQFGGNGYTIANNLGLSQAEGEEIYSSYMESFDGIHKYFKEVSQDVMEKGYVTFNDITGRKSYVHFYSQYKRLKEEIDNFDWPMYRREKAHDTPLYKNVLGPKVREFFSMQGRLIRRSYNYPVQGTSADITKTAGCIIFEQLIKKGWVFTVKIVHVVHDELVLECPKELADEVSQLVKDAMEKAGRVFYTRVPLKATPVVGEFWGH